MKTKAKIAEQNEKDNFIYAVGEAVAMEIENVKDVKYLPLQEVCIPKFMITMKDGTEYLVSVVRVDKSKG